MQHPKIVDGLIQKTLPIPISASFAHVGSSAGAACDSFPTPHSYNRRFAHAGRIWGSPRRVRCGEYIHQKHGIGASRPN